MAQRIRSPLLYSNILPATRMRSPVAARLRESLRDNRTAAWTRMSEPADVILTW